MKDGRSFSEYMQDKKEVNRWLMVKVFIVGMFAGALKEFFEEKFGIGAGDTHCKRDSRFKRTYTK